jgi:hypothetical protein
MPERRRTRRVSLRIPIFVEGIDRSGNGFREQSTTVEINRDGARIGLKNTPPLVARILRSGTSRSAEPSRAGSGLG